MALLSQAFFIVQCRSGCRSSKHRPGRTTSMFIKYLYTLYCLCSVQLSRCLVRTQSLPCWVHCKNSLLTGNDIQGTSANYCEHLSTLSIRAYNSNTQHFAIYITVLTVACPLAARFDKPLVLPMRTSVDD